MISSFFESFLQKTDSFFDIIFYNLRLNHRIISVVSSFCFNQLHIYACSD